MLRLRGAKHPRSTSEASPDAAIRVAARHADVYLTWADPPARAGGPHVARVRSLAEAEGSGAALRRPPAHDRP